MVKWYIFWDSLTRQRSDGALIRLTTLLKPGEDESVADKRFEDFLMKANPMLGDYVPG